MAIDWTGTLPTSPHLIVLQDLLERDTLNCAMDYAASTHVPVKTMRWNRTTKVFEEYNGTAWVAQVVSVAGGGTGAVSGGGAIAALGLGTMATQNANNVAISGGTVSANLAGSTGLPATSVTGTVPQANLGTGATGGGNLYLADNQTWKPTVPAGSVMMYAGPNLPVGYLWCDGASVPQASYPALFVAIGGYYGISGGNFTLPDLRLRFPIGVHPGLPLTTTGGAWTHTHNVPSHYHAYDQVVAHNHTLNQTAHSHANSSFRFSGPGSDRVSAGTPGCVAGAYNGQPTEAANANITISPTGAAICYTRDDLNGVAGATEPTDGANPPFISLNFIIKY